jgi:hypothetical protein
MSHTRKALAATPNLDTAYISAETVSWLIFFGGWAGGYALQKSQCVNRTDGMCDPSAFFDYTMLGIVAGIVGSGVYLALELPKKDRYRAF